MNEEFSKVLSELVGSPVDMDFKQSFEKGGIDNNIILAVMQNKRLDRITDALESISSSLLKISVSLYSLDKTLDGCTYTGQTGSFLRVTGSVSTN